MIGVVEFLLARIAEDEAAAKAADAVPAPWGFWDDARVLAECEAKRRVIERCRPQYAVLYRESERLLASAFDQETMKTVGHSGPIWPFAGAEDTLRALAAVYADHPDYRDEWRLDRVP